MLAASEPACGSVSAKAPSSSPRAIGRRNRSFCRSLPNFRIGMQATELWTLMIVEQEPSPAATSSIASARATWPAPAPPHSSGTSMPSRPSSPICRMASAGKACVRSHSPAFGASCSAAKARAMSRIIVSSSLSSIPLFTPHRARRRRSSGAHFQLRKVLLPELHHPALVLFAHLVLVLAQLDPPDLAGDGLWKLGELQPADALVGGESRPRKPEDILGQLGT